MIKSNFFFQKTIYIFILFCIALQICCSEHEQIKNVFKQVESLRPMVSHEITHCWSVQARKLYYYVSGDQNEYIAIKNVTDLQNNIALLCGNERKKFLLPANVFGYVLGCNLALLMDHYCVTQY